jgi:hypothetical protein
MTKVSGCDVCNKSSLSLLLLRPSPVAIDSRLAVAGSESVLSDVDATAGLLPGRVPTESRFALRLLRPGYVYVHIPRPPAGTKEWLEYRVTEQGDIVPRMSGLFGQPTASVACSRNGHNAMGLKLISIPQAHKIDEVWIAYSANLWNQRLRDRNKANPRTMQKIVFALKDGNLNALTPTAETLKSKVLECALPYRMIDRTKDHEFPFNSLASTVNGLAEELTKAASAHQKTRGNELALVLRDPVGIAIELNELRLRRHELARREMERPENAYPLNSSHTLMGLKDFTVDDAFERAARNLAPIVSEKTFVSTYKSSKNPKFAGATWEALDPGPKNMTAEGAPLGRVWTNENREAFKEQMKVFQARNWAQMSSQYDEARRVKWLADFEKKMKLGHFDHLEKFEKDWWESCSDSGFKAYFEFHFDEDDQNLPTNQPSSGLIYTHEATLAQTPAPFTDQAVSKSYVQQLHEDVTKPSSVLLRALGANQAKVLAAIKGVLVLDTTVSHIHGERNDKLYDVAKETVLGAEGAANPNIVQKALVKYSWLSVALGDVMCGYTLTIAHSWVAAVTAVGLRSGTEFFGSAPGKKLLGLLGAVQLVQRAQELALESVVSGAALKTPMQISKKYPVGVAMHLLGARGGFSNSQIISAAREGTVELVLLTDNVEMASFQGSVETATKEGGGRVQFKAQQQSALLQAPQTARTVVIDDAKFEQLWRARVAAAAKATHAVQEVFRGGRAVLGSLEGRLAIGVTLINLVGLISSINNLSSTDAKVVRNAWMGMADSGLSVLGGALLTLEVAAKANVAARLGTNAVSRSVPLHTLRAAGFILGSIAGIVTVAGQWAKAVDANAAGYKDVPWLYGASAVAFAGSSLISGFSAAGAIADRAVARQVASVAVRRVALRYGAQGTAAALGISMSGWGLVLLAVGVLFEVGAVVMTPTELQKWLQRSYFGNGKGSAPKFLSLDEEIKALEEVFDVPRSQTN